MLKKKFTLGLLATAALLAPLAMTSTTYAAGENTARAVITPDYPCKMFVTETVHFPNGVYSPQWFVKSGSWSGDVPFYSWDASTNIATYQGYIYHFTCDPFGM